MRWKDGIIIAVIFFAIGITVEYLLLGCIVFGDFWGLLKVISGFMLGLLIGLFGGSDLLALIYNWYQKRKDKLEEERDKEQIYKWLYDKTKKYKEYTVGVPNDPRWASTREIAIPNHFTIDRVKYLCTIHKGILLMGEEDREYYMAEGEKKGTKKPLEEKWAIKEFVRKSPD